jgi:alkane 1-monooxygenase
VRRVLPHAIGFILPPVIVWCTGQGGLWLVAPLVLVYVIVPLLDRGSNAEKADEQGVRDLAADPRFRMLTWAWVPVQLAFIVWVIDVASRGTLAAGDLVLLTICVGVTTGGIGITFAHELIHRAGRFERLLGELLLGSVCYLHWSIEHVFGHHRYVGTPRDPETARAGESSYAFLRRSVVGGFRTAWEFERARATKGHGPEPPLRTALRNRVLWYGAAQAAAIAAVGAFGGIRALAVFIGQSCVAVILLEVINYIEHYGLFRREIAPGRYEPVRARHSWDSSHRVSNWMLINLARHADHHLTASKRYQVLDPLDTAPQLPAGYPTMVILALVPPLWRRVMDPRLAAAVAAQRSTGEPERTNAAESPAGSG